MPPVDHSQDLYAVLGLSPTASLQDVKSSYRAAARRFHPDINSSEGAAIQFREIISAYETLSDDHRRRNYDMMRQRLEQDPLYFSLNVTMSKRTLPVLSESQVLYILTQIQPNKDLGGADRQRTPINLVLVLDRSKSMRGARLDRVKLSAHQIIDQLSREDYLSVVAFSDKADPIIESITVTDKAALKSMVNIISANGGTEIYQGLSEAMRQVRKHRNTDYVNHIILLTDGETFDNKDLSLDLANEAAKYGIGISTMGIGDQWNDAFLDEIASRTGGHCAFINSPGAVVRFLNDRVRSLGSSFAERLSISIAPDPDVELESVFKLMPNPQPINIKPQPILLGALEYNRPISILIQLLVKATPQPAFRTLVRLEVNGDILPYRRQNYKVYSDLSVEVAQNPAIEDPPRNILDALGKLTLYRMQEKAQSAVRAGRVEEATTRLQNLATRLLDAGYDDLAQTVSKEVAQLKQTQTLSEEGRKTIKFGTRMLLSSSDDKQQGQ
jgi:Ca-activated chloride channel family protein